MSADLSALPDPPQKLRRLCVVLGDQLDAESAVFDAFDPAQDALLLTEAAEEATYLAQHKKRLVLFFAAMRHFALEQAALGRPLIYRRLDGAAPAATLAESLIRAIRDFDPEEIRVAQPGDHRVLTALEAAANGAGKPLLALEDRHFLVSRARFADWFRGRKRILLEDFYRAERKRAGWLMTEDGQPVGGAWNFDKDNRKSFGAEGPGLIAPRPRFEPDPVTREVIAMVRARFAAAPGAIDGFAEAVTRADALQALEDFIANRLPRFGDHQDAMATGHVTLNHSRLSTSLNLKLLHPREVCEAALAAYAAGRAPLNAVEGFVRQILGWREYVRGIYWSLMPAYAQRNGLGAGETVPAFFWTGETEMACLADGLGGVMREGYAHHIQRLMVMGLFMMLYGARPYAAHEWHMALYLDAIDWVSLPNVLGMSQHGDEGVVGSKPYAASGAYIDRMSDHCAGCPYDPKQATGPKACPFTTLYWSFLERHEDRFKPNMRMRMQLANLARKDAEERKTIRQAEAALRRRLTV
ncbi:MAG: cryptochrome/photolyase family protein [Pseudomonadota bacterium]